MWHVASSIPRYDSTAQAGATPFAMPAAGAMASAISVTPVPKAMVSATPAAGEGTLHDSVSVVGA